MVELENGTNGKQQRFNRDGNPYFDDFEITVSTLFSSQKDTNPFIASTIDMMKVMQNHLASCREVLSRTESLVEEARKNNSPLEDIEKLVTLCREQQEMQVKLMTEMIECINKVVDLVFPR